MKRLIIGITVLSLLLGMGIGVALLFGKVHNSTARLLETAGSASLTGDWERATDFFRQARDRWEHYRHFTAAFSDHEPMDEIDGLFAQLERYALQEDADHFPALCAHLAALAEAIADSQRLRWWTLL